MDKGLMAMRIKAIREKTGLNCSDFAKAIGMTKSAVSRWENGYCSKLNGKAIRAIVEAIGVDPKYLTDPECDSMSSGKLKIEVREEAPKAFVESKRGSTSNAKHLLALSCLTKDKVCKCAGIQRREFNRFLNGENSISFKTLVRLSFFFDCSMEFLTGLSDYWVGVNIIGEDESVLLTMGQLLELEKNITITIETTGEERVIHYKTASFRYGKFKNRRYARKEDIAKLSKLVYRNKK